MAYGTPPFGTFLGSLSVSAGSITNPFVATGTSFAVNVGDLIVGLQTEQTSGTTTAMSDSLGNTYFAVFQNLSINLGNNFANLWYTVVSKGGTLTSVSTTNTASAHDAAFVVMAFAGPFKGPGANVARDLNVASVADALKTSPQDCPSARMRPHTGQVLIGWEGQSNDPRLTSCNSGAPVISVGATNSGAGMVYAVSNPVSPNVPGSILGMYTEPFTLRMYGTTFDTLNKSVVSFMADLPANAYRNSMFADLLGATQVAAVVDNPPFSHPERNPLQTQMDAFMQAPDPWVYLFNHPAQGRQPYGYQQLPPTITAVPVNDPPFSIVSRQLDFAQTRAWQDWAPDPWPYLFFESQQPYGMEKTDFVPGSSVDSPPVRHPARQANTLQIQAAFAAQPDPWPYMYIDGEQPYGTNKQDFIDGQSVDNPPFVHVSRQKGNQAAFTMQWQPEAWPYIYVDTLSQQPYAQGKISAGVPGQSIDNPPRYTGVLADMINTVASWQPVDPFPQQPRPSYATQPVVAVTYVPFSRSWMPSVVQTWLLPDIPPTLPRNLNPTVTAVQVDNPPGFINDYLPYPVDPWPYAQLYNRPFYPIEPTVAVTYVPVGVNDTMPTILASWQLPDPALVQRAKPFIAGSSVENPPFIHPERQSDTIQIRASFAQPDPWTWVYPEQGSQGPYAQGKLSEGIPGLSVDNPPFAHPSRQPDALQNAAAQAWQPEPWPFVFLDRGGQQPYAPGITQVVSVDNPQFSVSRLINFLDVVAQWQPADPIFTQRHAPSFLPGSSVDNPPFVQRGRAQQQNVVTATWQPDPWVYEYLGASWGRQPYGYRGLTFAPPRTDNPPFDMRLRTTRDIVQAWQPDPWAYSRFYTRGKFIPFTQATIIKHPTMRGTLTLTTLIGRDADPSLRGTSGDPDLEGDP